MLQPKSISEYRLALKGRRGEECRPGGRECAVEGARPEVGGGAASSQAGVAVLAREAQAERAATRATIGGTAWSARGSSACPVTSPCITSPRSAAVLMEQAAKAIAAFHPAVRGWGHIGRSARRPLPEALVWPMPRACDRDQVLAALSQWHRQHGCVPTQHEWDESAGGSRPWSRTIQRRWGWHAVWAEALGLDQVQSSRTSTGRAAR
jgi:hypothetical protein